MGSGSQHFGEACSPGPGRVLGLATSHRHWNRCRARTVNGSSPVQCSRAEDGRNRVSHTERVMVEQPWFVHYPEGVPKELSLSAETLTAMFARSAQRFSRRPALYFFGKTLSYQECHSLIERFASGLAALGVRKGDRVALCLPNSPQAVIAYFGIVRAGGIVVACNPTYTEHELSHQLRDAGARAIVVLDLMY